MLTMPIAAGFALVPPEWSPAFSFVGEGSSHAVRAVFSVSSFALAIFQLTIISVSVFFLFDAGKIALGDMHDYVARNLPLLAVIGMQPMLVCLVSYVCILCTGIVLVHSAPTCLACLAVIIAVSVMLSKAPLKGGMNSAKVYWKVAPHCRQVAAWSGHPDDKKLREKWVARMNGQIEHAIADLGLDDDTNEALMIQAQVNKETNDELSKGNNGSSGSGGGVLPESKVPAEMVDHLTRLSQLLKDGLLTRSEFDLLKNKILTEISI